METQLVYCDETGDDGNNTLSSNIFVLTSLYMPSNSWQKNYEIMRSIRKHLKEKYGFHVKQEMHTKQFLTDKGQYREYRWTDKQKREILSYFVHLYYKTHYKKEKLPTRVGRLINEDFITKVLDNLGSSRKLNLKASSNKYGLVIYPKK